MIHPLLLLVGALSAALAAPAHFDDGVPEVIVPEKRAALVLDRLLVALQNALHEERVGAVAARALPLRDGPRAAPLIAHEMTALQRRGQPGRGRVLRCYFNAVTCF